MADKIVSQDPTKPGVDKVNGPTLTATFQIPLSGLDNTVGNNGDVIAKSAGVWGPSAAPPSADTASNLGAGAQVFKSKVGADFQFRTLIGAGGTTVTQNANDITISSVVETASNLGAGTGVFSSKVGVDFQFKTLLAGSNITLTPTATDITISASGGGSDAFILLQDQKAANTQGGTFTSGSYQTRVINTEVADTGNNCSIAANQITLAAGTYRCLIMCPAFQVNEHKARLRDITNTATVAVGTSSISSAGSCSNMSVIEGRFTIAGSTVFEIQHQCFTTAATNGFGVACNMTEVEVFTTAMFWKE